MNVPRIETALAPASAPVRRILDRALHLFHEVTEAGRIIDLDEAWSRDFTDVVDRTLGATEALLTRSKAAFRQAYQQLEGHHD